MKKIKRIIIVSTYVYCGGPLVLAELCRCLCRQGVDARLLLLHSFPTNENDLQSFSRKSLLFCNAKLTLAMLLNRIFPFFKIHRFFFSEYFQASHLKQCKLQINPFFSNKNTVVLYPEIVYGNPLQAKNVVRLFLFHNRYPNDVNAYGDKDLFLCHREIFNDKRLAPSPKVVKINVFDKNLYKQTNFAKRTGICYIIRKGFNRTDLPQKFEGIVIDTLPEDEKVKVFNQSEYCYCYDTQTFYSCIASICGCKTIVIPEPGKTRLDYQGKGDKPLYGVAFGISGKELEWAQSTRKKLIDSLNYEDSNKKNTLCFIEYVKDFFIK